MAQFRTINNMRSKRSLQLEQGELAWAEDHAQKRIQKLVKMACTHYARLLLMLLALHFHKHSDTLSKNIKLTRIMYKYTKHITPLNYPETYLPSFLEITDFQKQKSP